MKLTKEQAIGMILRQLPKGADDAQRRDATRVLRACMAAIDGPDGTRAAIDFLKEVEVEYGSWFGEVEAAIKAARADFPLDLSGAFYDRLEGAAAMAGSFLLNAFFEAQGRRPLGDPQI